MGPTGQQTSPPSTAREDSTFRGPGEGQGSGQTVSPSPTLTPGQPRGCSWAGHLQAGSERGRGP